MKILFFTIILYFSFFSLFRFQSFDSPNKVPDLIFFEIRDASQSSTKSSPQPQFFESGCDSFQQGNQFDPTNQNLHQGQCSNHYQNIIRLHSEQLRSHQSKFTFSFLKKHISNKKLQHSCPNENSLVVAVKSYWRHGGYVPIDDTKKEIRKANFDKNHTPDFLDSIRIAGFLFFGEQVPENQKFQVKHELLGLCITCTDAEENLSYHHFIIDRNANAELPDIWNTKIRMIYIGEGESCKENDKGWAEKRSSGLHIRAQSYDLQQRKYEIGGVLKDIKNYFNEFPKYNALYNCQHFANNLYNKITGKREEFINKDVMILKERGGKTNEHKLIFNFEEI